MAGITRRADTMGGAYCLAGTRMPVVAVKQIIAGVGIPWLKREYPWITDAQIADALAFRKSPDPLNRDESRG